MTMSRKASMMSSGAKTKESVCMCCVSVSDSRQLKWLHTCFSQIVQVKWACSKCWVVTPAALISTEEVRPISTDRRPWERSTLHSCEVSSCWYWHRGGEKENKQKKIKRREMIETMSTWGLYSVSTITSVTMGIYQCNTWRRVTKTEGVT